MFNSDDDAARQPEKTRVGLIKFSDHAEVDIGLGKEASMMNVMTSIGKMEKMGRCTLRYLSACMLWLMRIKRGVC